MKRVVICSVLLAIIIAVSAYSHVRVMRADDGMDARIGALVKMLPDGDREALVKGAGELSEYWTKQENILVHLTHHSHLDQISSGAARLPFLAAHGDLGEFGAVLAEMRRQMEHIRESEALTPKNLI